MGVTVLSELESHLPGVMKPMFFLILLPGRCSLILYAPCLMMTAPSVFISYGYACKYSWILVQPLIGHIVHSILG